MPRASVQAARYAEQAAQEALNFDYQDRIHNCGPWDEDDTYLRLNGKVAASSAQLLNVALRRTCETDHVRKDDIPALVGCILRHCTATERGAMLADLWDRVNGIDTGGIANPFVEETAADRLAQVTEAVEVTLDAFDSERLDLLSPLTRDAFANLASVACGCGRQREDDTEIPSTGQLRRALADYREASGDPL
jgi:hypothetical protein